MSESRTIASPPPSGGRLGMTVSHFFSLLLEPISKPCDFVHQEGHGFLVLSEVEGSRADKATKYAGLQPLRSSESLLLRQLALF